MRRTDGTFGVGLGRWDYREQQESDAIEYATVLPSSKPHPVPFAASRRLIDAVPATQGFGGQLPAGGGPGLMWGCPSGEFGTVAPLKMSLLLSGVPPASWTGLS